MMLFLRDGQKFARLWEYDRARRGKRNHLKLFYGPLQHRAPGKFDQGGVKGMSILDA
jgi:hypothetical protein